MALVVPGNGETPTSGYRFDFDVRTGWVELQNIRGFQAIIDTAQSGGEEQMLARVKAFVETVNPDWFVLALGDGDNPILMLLTNTTRWSDTGLTAAALSVELEFVDNAGDVFSFRPWSGYWHSEDEIGYDFNSSFTVTGDLPGTTLTISEHSIRLRDDENTPFESITLFPTTEDNLSRDDRRSIGWAEGRQQVESPPGSGDFEPGPVTTLKRNESIQYDVIYQTNRRFYFVGWDWDGIELDFNGFGNFAQGGVTTSTQVAGSAIDMLIAELNPIAYTINHNGSYNNAPTPERPNAGIDGTEIYENLSSYDLLMILDKPPADCKLLLQRLRRVTEEPGPYENDERWPSGEELNIPASEAKKYWNREAILDPRTAIGQPNGWADDPYDTRVTQDSDGDADDIHMWHMPAYFSSTADFKP